MMELNVKIDLLVGSISQFALLYKLESENFSLANINKVHTFKLLHIFDTNCKL